MAKLHRLQPPRFVVVPWHCRVSPQHRPTKLTPQPQRLASSQPLEQHRIRHCPGVTAAAPLQLRLAVLLRIRRSWLARSTPRHRPDVARNQICDRLLLCCHRRHRCPVCVLKQCACNREGSEVGTLRPGKGEVCCHATELGHRQTHHVRGAFPFAGGSGLACRPYAPVSFLAAGQRRRTWSLRALAPISTGSHSESAPVRPVCVRLRCPSASPPGHVSQGASRIVGLGDWLLDISVEPCQTLPVCVGPFGNGFHNAVRSSPSGPHCFQGLLSFAPKRLAHKSSREVGGLLGSFSPMARSHARPSLPGCGRDGPAQRSSVLCGAAGRRRSRRWRWPAVAPRPG